MLMLIKFAFRNIFRFKRRTFITFCAISVGLALLVITISLLNGIDNQSISNIINCQTSHIKVFRQGYLDKKDNLPMNLTISRPEQVREILKDIPNVVSTESRILFAAGLIKGMDELPCLGVGIQPELDPDVFKIKESLVEGEWLEPGEAKMLVGKNLARDIGLAVGDLVTVRMVTSSKGEDLTWNAVDLEIKGIFDTGNPSVDSGRIVIPLAQAREGLSLEATVTEVVVRLNSDDDDVVAEARDAIHKKLNDRSAKHGDELEVVTWKDLAGTFLVINEVKSKRSGTIIFIMLLIASMGIINTMLMGGHGTDTGNRYDDCHGDEKKGNHGTPLSWKAVSSA